MYSPLILLYLLEVLGFFGIGALALIRQKANRHKAFFLFAASLGLWQFLQALALLFYASPVLAITLLTLSVVASSLMATSVYIFSRVYAGKSPYIWTIIPALAIGCLAFFSAGIQETQITQQALGIPKLDLFYSAVILFDVIMLFLSIATFVRYYMTTNSTREKAQTKIMLICVAISGFVLAASSFNSSDFSNTLIAQQVIPVTCFVTLCVFLYAMTYRNLFDIHLFVLRAASYASTYVITLIVLTVPLVYFFAYLLHYRMSPVGAFGISVGLLLFAYAVQISRKQLDKITSSVFFRNIYDVQSFLDEHNNAIISHGELRPLLHASKEVIEKYIQADFVTMWLDGASQGKPLYMGTNDAKHITNQDAERIVEMIKKIKEPIIFTDEIDVTHQAIKEFLTNESIAALIRLESTEGRVSSGLGWIFLGNKKSGDTYGMRDRQSLQIISNELTLAVQNALRFEEIQGLNESLQVRINEATSELRMSNKKLKNLDKSKDEFISMASHQLRTPLTAVKGYISMVLEGDMGKITSAQREVLEQAFDSSQRMVFLIGDFLNVSRIQTGKFVLEPSKVNYTKVVEEEVDQLIDTARIRNITLRYDKPSTEYFSWADENKLRQVMMNFIDNAIFYSPGGSQVNIQLYKDGGDIVFKVNDQGIGVPKSEQAKLFTKFFRAGNARQQRPDGTGIGIYMAKKVILSHGGTIIFESKEGIGSTFGFRMPLENDPKQLTKQPGTTAQHR